MTQAIECWLSDPARFEPGADPSGIHGYQWKSLFLPRRHHIEIVELRRKQLRAR
ncbi:hypothetical protein [Duganella caerulea]|uniref:hypothetical protein n=1 Tax=Duganella caerulea TaxID=2885762 RepID=UPI004038234E